MPMTCINLSIQKCQSHRTLYVKLHPCLNEVERAGLNVLSLLIITSKQISRKPIHPPPISLTTRTLHGLYLQNQCQSSTLSIHQTGFLALHDKKGHSSKLRTKLHADLNITVPCVFQKTFIGKPETKVWLAQSNLTFAIACYKIGIEEKKYVFIK